MNESAILYNQQRHEKVTYKNTKTTANNQRENYKDQNRSTIFLHDSSVNSSYLTVRHNLLHNVHQSIKD